MVFHGEIICLHAVINVLWPPEPDQNMPYLSPYHWPMPNSAKLSIDSKFCENIEIPWKQANSMALFKILRKLWSLTSRFTGF